MRREQGCSANPTTIDAFVSQPLKEGKSLYCNIKDTLSKKSTINAI